MSKKSAAELAVARPPTELDRRLPPPADLSAFEAQIWSSIVATKPADWFQADCAPILHSYCKHIGRAAVLDSKIDQFDPDEASGDDWTAYLKLIDARRKESGVLMTCATKLRLAPQSRYDAGKAAVANRKTESKRLWEQ